MDGNSKGMENLSAFSDVGQVVWPHHLAKVSLFEIRELSADTLVFSLRPKGKHIPGIYTHVT